MKDVTAAHDNIAFLCGQPSEDEFEVDGILLVGGTSPLNVYARTPARKIVSMEFWQWMALPKDYQYHSPPPVASIDGNLSDGVTAV